VQYTDGKLSSIEIYGVAVGVNVAEILGDRETDPEDWLWEGV